MSQNLWVLIGKGIAKKIHCCFAVFILLTFVGAAHAAGYTCSSYKKYTSCNSGYYISNCPTSSSSWTGQTISSSALTTGNSCKSCPSGYSCSGGLVCPKRNTVTITLNKNGGSGYIGTGTAMAGGTSSATITCTVGEPCALPVWSSNVSASAKNTNITNGKKIFLGWGPLRATEGFTEFTPTANTTLYAVWATPTCSATNGSCTIQNASQNRPTALISCSTGYSKSGGSNTTTSFTVYGTAGATSVSGSCAAKCNRITLNVTQNGGEYSDPSSMSLALYKKTGSTAWYSNSSCTAVNATKQIIPVKDNATFAGFYNTSAASGGTQFINSSGTLLAQGTVTGPTTLYAQYTCNTGYTGSGTRISGKCNPIGLTITLNKNGGSGTLKTDESQTTGTASAQMLCYYNQPCTLPSWHSTNNNITNGSKVFVGWATTSTATAGSFTIKSTTNRTLYAVWKTPTCSATNGSCAITTASSNRPTAEITCSKGYSANGGLAGGDIPLISGFIAYGTAGATSVSGSCLANCNTITFNSTQNGGSGGWSTKLYKKTGNSTWYSNSSCSTVRTAAITKPTKTNATFAGFYNTSAASGGTQFISSTGALLTTSGLTVTAPTTLYAQYDCNTGYTGTGTRISGKCNPIGLTITLNKNGGSGILKTDESQTTGTASAQMLCYYNQPCTLPSWDDTDAEHRNNITNGQKVFTGWATVSAVREDDTGVFTMTFTANDVVYAVWVQPTCTVTGGHGTCTLRNASQNKPTAYFSCNTGYAQTATSSTTGWQQTGTAGATSVVDECVARQFKCAAGTYLNGTTCSTCQTLYYCPGGTFTYNGASQGDNRCPVTAIDQTADPWRYASDPGAKAQTDCYVYGNAADFSDYCAAGQWRLYYDSSEGDYKTFTEHSTVTAKPGAYINTSNHISPKCSPCQNATYSEGGDVHECDSCPTIYTDNTTAGKSSANQCQVRTDAGYYIAAPRDDEQTGCPIDSFCTSALVNYGSTNAPEKCPDAATHIMTTYPSNYYDVQTITNKNQTWGYEHKKSSSECLATYYGTNERGNFNVESVGYNPDTGKYDRGGSMYYGSISPGYYAEDKMNDTYCDDSTHRMYYRDAKPCPADSYCPGFTSMPLCSSGEYTETNGINACPSGYLDNEELRKTAISQCQREVSSKVYIATAGGTTPSICPAGSACPGGMLGYGDIGPINKCTGATYSLDSSASCSDCPAGYDDDLSDGKTRQTACKISVPAGDYMDVPGGTTTTECTTKHYCPGGMVGYGSTLEPTACPDPETHLTTEYPDSYYDAKFSVISVQAWFTGGEPWTKETDCRAVYSLDNSRGHLIADNVVYNASTQKYDQFIRWPYYVSINPGYYASSKYDEATCDYDNNTMLYKDAQPCPAGSYCPGLTSMPSCTSGTYNDTLGINACPANYGTSPAQSTANTQCYLTTTAGKWVATKNAAQTSCTAGGFCVGGVKVNYGSTGGRTLCVTGAYSGAGATACIACEDGTTTSGAGQSSCNAKCANATDSKGDEAVKTWAETTWNTNNTVSDLCVAVRCFGGDEGHYLDNGNCPRCDSLANGLYPRSPQGGTSDGPEACFLYESDIPGQYIATQKATSATDCPLATYQAGSERAIHYGEFSECDTCPDNTYADEEGLAQCKKCLENYTTYGEKNSPSACRISCPAGAYLATANATECTNVGVGYWAAQSYVTQGNVGVRNKCASGLTTIGFGAGADEASDCGRVLNVGDVKLYLRSAKKTDLALNVNIGGTTYYGNMSTEDKFMSDGIEKSLKLNVDGTIYSVYDDSGEYYSGGGSSAVSISPNLEATSTVPANYNDDNGLNWSANMSNGVVISGVAGCDSTTAENGDIAASGFTPSGSGNGCYCRITSPGDGGTRWVYATTHNQCSTKCAYMCADNMKGDSSKKITYRTNLYQVAGILGS